jgi:transcriptional regulator with PAS, ATPase and Fis domain
LNEWKEDAYMATYKIPDEIRTHNRLLTPVKPFEVDGVALNVLQEYESIIKIQRRGLTDAKETMEEVRHFSLREQGLVGVSYEIRRVRDLTRRIGHSDATVLIMAETGCGKEVIANEVQRYSGRWNKPYIKVNCSAFPETLFESELFGYEEGAFTGALKKGKKGLFEAASGGTIFLDEIGELPLSMQAKLLRVLQEQEITRVGGIESIPVDIRVIAATNQDMRKLVNEGRFRQDLFFRLNVLPITISPLRDRKDDIVELASHFINKYSQKYNSPHDLTQSAEEALCAYNWPGNVRELENIMERLVVWGTSEHLERDDILMVSHYEEEYPLVWYEPEQLSLTQKLAVVEKTEIIHAMRRYGTTRKAAAALGLTQSTLVRRMQEHKIYLEPADS